MNYFSKAKAAAKKTILKTGDVSAAHSVAIKVIRDMVPNKPEAFYGGMGWQTVLAARADIN